MVEIRETGAGDSVRDLVARMDKDLGRNVGWERK